MAYISEMERDRNKLPMDHMFSGNSLSKGVEHISEVTMTLAKMQNFVFCRVKDFKDHW